MADSIKIATQKITAKKTELQKDKFDLGSATSEVLEAGYGGWYQTFKHGNIYSHHAVGTYAISGKILDVYLKRKANGENPNLNRREFGFPTSDVARTMDKRFPLSKFEWGQIIDVDGTRGVSISGEIHKAWLKTAGINPMEGLGYPINGNVKVAGGEVVFFERGLMYYNPSKITTPIEVRIAPPLLGNPAIVIPGEKNLPIDVSISAKDLESLGGNEVVLKALEGRFFLQEVAGTQRIPILLEPKKSGTVVTVRPPGRPAPPPAPGQTVEPQKELSFLWTPGKGLKNRMLYDLVFRMDNGSYYPYSPHAIYTRTTWKDFGLIHATDTHVARRIDEFKHKLREAKEKYKRTDLDEGIKNLNNWNDGFRDLVRYANFLYKEGILDGILATGDLVDYQFEKDDNQLGVGNFDFLKKLILGQVEYPDGDQKAEELKVPIFTVLGNHDYRVNAYKLFCGATPGGWDFLPSLHDIREYHGFNLTENEARAIQDGRPSEVLYYNMGQPVQSNYGKPDISLSAALRMVDIEQPQAYFKYINSEKSYAVQLGKHRLVMLDSGPDTGLPEGKWDAFAIGMGYGGEDKQTTSRGGPNSEGFNINQLQVTHVAQRETKAGGIIIIGTHSPLFNPWENEFPHYFRETEHPTADEKEMANYFRRNDPTIIYPTDQQLHNDLLLKRVKDKYKDWPLTGTAHFKTGDHKRLLDDGVSRGDTERFLKMCVGLEYGNEGDPIRPVDLILYGHRHTRVEMRLKWNASRKELQYFNDFYTENPAIYYSSRKYKNEIGYSERVNIKISAGAKPNGQPRNVNDQVWGLIPTLEIPPYANPLANTNNPAQWWQQHRPLFIEGAPLGPCDNNTRLDKEENKYKPDPSFEGCKLMIVRGDTITQITQVSRNELEKNSWELPKGISTLVL